MRYEEIDLRIYAAFSGELGAPRFDVLVRPSSGTRDPYRAGG